MTSLDAATTSIGVSENDTFPVPEIIDTQFVHVPSSKYSFKVFHDLQLGTCLGRDQIVENFVVPNWDTPQIQGMPQLCRKQLVELVLSQYSSLSTKSQLALRSLPIIPVECAEETETSTFAPATELIDPTSSDLLALFFNDERFLPDKKLFEEFPTVLRVIGLKSYLDHDLVRARVNHYSSCSQPVSDIKSRVEQLLRSHCPSAIITSISQNTNFRTLKWLPVVSAETQQLVLTAPVDCRCHNDRLLVESQMPVFEMSVSNEWMTQLGWHETLPQKVLLGQLRHGIKEESREVIDAVLKYISKLGDFNLWHNELSGLPFICTSSSALATPAQAFAPPKSRAFNCERLYPYFGNVDRKFWRDHKALLGHLGVIEGPTTEDLLTILAQLETKIPLDDANVAVAVELCRLASFFPRSDLKGFKVLSNTLQFVPIEEISFPDPGTYVLSSTKNITHPQISETIAAKLSIALLSERLRDEELEISADNEFEDYEQQEDMTTSIARTLESYVIGSTFNEYLANADDTENATSVNWLLDGRTHAQDNLCQPDLKAAQGPALLMHNDDGRSKVRS
jgi:sacsin